MTVKKVEPCDAFLRDHAREPWDSTGIYISDYQRVRFYKDP